MKARRFLNGINEDVFIFILFSSFMFLQFVILRIANQSGKGLLPDEKQEHVYYLLQVFVIIGFLLFAATEKTLRSFGRSRSATTSALMLLFAGASGMFFSPFTSVLSLIFTFFTCVVLGFVGGFVYLRMSEAAKNEAKVALGMGVGCSVAVVLQFVFQLTLQNRIVLAILMILSFALLFLLLFTDHTRRQIEETSDADAVPFKNLLFTAGIALLFLLISAFYNGYIHHLQVMTSYTDYNVYSWPRLMLIPGYLLFAALGSQKKFRIVPIAALCIVILALLNAVLVLTGGSYRLNMCLFYISLSASVSYYDLSFWRIACRTKNPAFWASAGRILDSVNVLIAGSIRFSEMPTAAVLAFDVAALAVLIVLMTLNGDFSIHHSELENADPVIPKPDSFLMIQNKYGLTPTELNVFRELVLTEDIQSAIGDRLSIKVRTVQANVTSIYRKTGVSTRAGLVQLYNENE